MRNLFVTTLLGICALAALIFLLNDIALEYFLFWTFWWYDIVMHFLGGLLIGACLVWGIARTGVLKNLSFRTTFTWTLVGVLFVGLGWELFEYTNGFFIGETNVVADTLLDLLMDVIGGAVSVTILFKILKKTETPAPITLTT